MSPPTWPLVIAAAAVVGAAACVPPLAPPPGAQLSCANSDDCPAGFACATAQQRCVVDGGSCVVGGAVLDDGTSCESAGVLVGVCNVGVCAESSCGDGVVAASEGCDDGAANSDVDPDACRTDCTLARCGDGVTDSIEACDFDGELGGRCARCERLTCRPDRANCNLDGSDGCECSPVALYDSTVHSFAIDDGRGLVLSFIDDLTLALEQVDLETGARDVLTTFSVPPDRVLTRQLVIVDQSRFLIVNGSVFRIDEGALALVRAPRDDGDRALWLAGGGGFLVARTERSIVSFRPDGSAESPLSDAASSTLDDGFERTALEVTADGDVAWLHRQRLRRIRIDGSETTPREHPTPVRSGGPAFLASVGPDVLAWDTSVSEGIHTLLRLSSATAVELTRVVSAPPVGSQFGVNNLRVGPIAVDDEALFTTIEDSEVPALSRLIVVGLGGGPARVVAATGGNDGLAAAGGKLLYREGSRVRLLKVSP